MGKCKRCYSCAINHHCHGRDGSEPELCDVCFWRSRAELATATLKTIRFIAIDADIRQLADEAIISCENAIGEARADSTTSPRQKVN
jgi:hypothetical protein